MSQSCELYLDCGSEALERIESSVGVRFDRVEGRDCWAARRFGLSLTFIDGHDLVDDRDLLFSEFRSYLDVTRFAGGSDHQLLNAISLQICLVLARQFEELGHKVMVVSDGQHRVELGRTASRHRPED